MDFHFRLRCLILETGLSQKELAKEVEVSQSTISSWVHGKTEPSLTHLIRLVSSLRFITLDDLVYGNDYLDKLLKEKYAGKFVEQTKLDL